MAQSLKGRSLLTLGDYTAEEIRLLLDTAREYRRLKYAGIPHRIHEGKTWLCCSKRLQHEHAAHLR